MFCLLEYCLGGVFRSIWEQYWIGKNISVLEFCLRAVLKGRKCFWSSIGSVCALYSEHCSVFWRQSVVWKGREMLQSISWVEYWDMTQYCLRASIGMVGQSVVWE